MNRRQLLRIAGAAGMVGGVGIRRARADDEVIYSNARILTGMMPTSDGESAGLLEVQGGIHVSGGMIVDMGSSVTGGIDLGGAVVWPGTWESGTTAGIAEIDLEAATHDDSETGDPLEPQMRVTDGYNPQSVLIPVLRARGVMGGLVMPGGGIVSGQAAWMRTTGVTVEKATVLDPAGLVINLGRTGVSDKGPSSRMGVAARLRDVLDANPPPPEPPRRSIWHKPPPVDPNKKPPTKAETVWHDLQNGYLKAIFTAERASDIEVALGIIRDYYLDAVILGCSEAWMLADAIAESGVPLIVGPVTVQPDSYDHLHVRYDNAALLHKAGVLFGLRIGDPHRAFDLTTEAGIAVANGLPWDVAIAAISGNSPSLFGLDLGRIQVGAEATFVVSDGDPLEPRSSVKRVVVQGVDVPLTNHQTELYDRFKVLK